MSKQIKDFKNIVQQQLCLVFFFVLLTTNVIAAEKQNLDVRINFEAGKEIDAKQILMDEYGNQDYQTCDVSDVAVGKTHRFIKPTNDPNLPKLVIDRKLPSCKSVVYFVKNQDSDKYIRFQYTDSRFYNLGFALTKDTLDKRGSACEAIKDVFKAIQMTR